MIERTHSFLDEWMHWRVHVQDCHGNRTSAKLAWCTGVWCMVHGAWCIVHGARVYGVWCMVHGVWWHQLMNVHGLTVDQVSSKRKRDKKVAKTTAIGSGQIEC